MTSRRFSPAIAEALNQAKILGVRSGDRHRYTGVWVVVVEGRVFVRSWSNRPTGWYQAFREEPRGSVRVGERELAVRAVATRSEYLQQAVSAAYARKYDTRASQKWVTGFAEPGRAQATLELVPA